MSSNKAFSVFSCFFAVVLLFQNCGKDLKSSNTNRRSLTLCKLAGKPGLASPFDLKKVHIDPGFQTASLQKLGGEATKYSLLVDVACVNSLSEPLRFLDQEISLNDRQKTLSRVPVDVQLSSSSNMVDVENAMASSNCFIGLAENPKLSLSQSLTPIPVNDPQSDQQLHLGYLGYAYSRDLQTNISSQVIVSFVDSGIDDDHADLDSRMWQDAQGNHGWNYVSDNANTFDDNGHGTHVAGILGAIEDNSFGVSGLTGSYVRMMAMKAMGADGRGDTADVHQAILDSITNGADIINLSIERPGQNALFEDAIIQAINANIVVVMAAGNGSELMTDTNLFAPGYMGANLNGAINVASVNASDSNLSIFTNYSSVYAEIAAPGSYFPDNSVNSGVLSTSPRNSWSRLAGTSQSAPMVSSAAAMLIGYLKTNNVSYTNAGIESFIKSDGAARSGALSPYLQDGRILSLGFLAENLVIYLANNQDPDFQGEPSTGLTCDIP